MQCEVAADAANPLSQEAGDATIADTTAAAVSAAAAVVAALQARELAPQLSAEWFRIRQQEVLSATDIGALLGLDPYKTRRATITKKAFPELDVFRGNAMTEHGKRYESVVKQLYSRTFEEPVAELGLLRHPTIAFVAASPDGIGCHSLQLVEIKCPVRRLIQPGVVPPAYYAQIQTQLQVTQASCCQYVEASITEVDGVFAPGCAAPGEFDGAVLGRATGSGWSYVYAFADADGTPLSYHQAAEQLQAQAQPGDRLWSYKVQDWQAVAVPRDDAWWAIQLPLLESAWREILHLRAQGPAAAAAATLLRKRKRPEAPAAGAGSPLLAGLPSSLPPHPPCSFLEDDDETELLTSLVQSQCQ